MWNLLNHSYQAITLLNQDLMLSIAESIFFSIFFFKTTTAARIVELTTHAFTSKPVAPADCIVANADPAATFPIED